MHFLLEFFSPKTLNSPPVLGPSSDLPEDLAPGPRKSSLNLHEDRQPSNESAESNNSDASVSSQDLLADLLVTIEGIEVERNLTRSCLTNNAPVRSSMKLPVFSRISLMPVLESRRPISLAKNRRDTFSMVEMCRESGSSEPLDLLNAQLTDGLEVERRDSIDRLFSHLKEIVGDLDFESKVLG
jgi:hypothetical protein